MKYKRIISALLCLSLFVSALTSPAMTLHSSFDVNCDGIVSCEDADLVLKWTLLPKPDSRADVTGDGKVDHSDAEDILKIVLAYGLYDNGGMLALTAEQRVEYIIHTDFYLTEISENKAVFKQCLTPVQLHRPPPYVNEMRITKFNF